MENYGWYVAGTALIATATACWGQLRSFFSQLVSRLIVTVEINDLAAIAALTYLQQRFVKSRFGLRTYTGWRMFVRPRRRREAVAMEVLGKGQALYWRGWLPIWASRTSNSANQADTTVVYSRPLSLTFFRGTIDPDRFVIEATDLLNELHRDRTELGCRRYNVVYVSGSDGKTQLNITSQGESPVAVAKNSHSEEDPAHDDLLGRKILKWAYKDIGIETTSDGHAIDRLSLSKDALEIVEEIRLWLTSQDWHRERSVPWRRSYGLFGEPGTGKTCLVRAIAEDLDLPIYSYDLATLYNDELHHYWSRMLANTPCIALIEDVDAVFEGRENRKGHLTFDSLLNCLDGVERSDGLLLFLTSNHPEQLDPALGVAGEGGMTSRPGRVDRILTMKKLDGAGRTKMAARILADWPEVQRELVLSREALSDTGAQFERRCVQLATQMFWERKKTQRPVGFGFDLRLPMALRERTVTVPTLREEVFDDEH